MSDDKKSVRLLRLIQLLCKSAPRRWRAVELAAELGTNKRNIYRDIEDVGEFIGLIEDPPLYWVESGQAVLARLSLTENELRSLTMSTRSLVDPSLRKLVRQVLDKVSPNVDSTIVAEVERLKRHLPDAAWAAAVADRYELLSKAVTHGLRLEMTYHSLSRAEPVKRRVDPYTLFPTRGVWYFSGFDHLSSTTRTFRVSRVDELRLTEERFVPAPERGMTDYLSSGDELTHVELEVCPLTARLLEESPIHPSQRIQDQRVTLQVGQPGLLVPCLLCLPDVTVQEPPELRNSLAEQAEAIWKRHRGRTDPKCPTYA